MLDLSFVDIVTKVSSGVYKLDASATLTLSEESSDNFLAISGVILLFAATSFLIFSEESFASSAKIFEKSSLVMITGIL